MPENEFNLDDLPGEDEMTPGDEAKLQTDPDFIAFRDGTGVLPEHRISPERAREIAAIARKRFEEEEKKKKQNSEQE